MTASTCSPTCRTAPSRSYSESFKDNKILFLIYDQTRPAAVSPSFYFRKTHLHISFCKAKCSSVCLAAETHTSKQMANVAAGCQAADRQACRTLWAQVLSSSVTECLSGSCSSLDVMFLWTICKKLLAPAGGRERSHRYPSCSLSFN